MFNEDQTDNMILSLLNETRDTLDKLAKLGNGDQYGNSIGNIIAKVMLDKINTKIKAN